MSSVRSSTEFKSMNENMEQPLQQILFLFFPPFFSWIHLEHYLGIP